MDPLTNQALSALLPPKVVEYLHVHVLNPSSPFQVFWRNAADYAHRAVDAALPVLNPLVDRVLDAMAENQGVTGLVFTLAIITVVVVIMNWIRRLMMWWTRLVMRVAFWAIIIAIFAVAWERGPMQSARDIVVFSSKIVGYLAALRDVWVSEYNHYESQRVGTAGRGARSHR